MIVYYKTTLSISNVNVQFVSKIVIVLTIYCRFVTVVPALVPKLALSHYWFPYLTYVKNSRIY